MTAGENSGHPFGEQNHGEYNRRRNNPKRDLGPAAALAPSPPAQYLNEPR